jgi:hypothetical protein
VRRDSLLTRSERLLISNKVSRVPFLNNCCVIDPSWNVIVGKNFGSHVVHQTKSYLFASYGDDEIYVLIWKSG